MMWSIFWLISQFFLLVLAYDKINAFSQIFTDYHLNPLLTFFFYFPLIIYHIISREICNIYKFLI